MEYLIYIASILAPVLLVLEALGSAIEWYNAWKSERQQKPIQGQYPAPKRREIVFGDELDDFIARGEEDIA